ncbi:MAG: tRNA (adenosine(37)-N6)-threonylcarbamoyltransferase complex transferase subunit TsaD [Melioribacteraceae bacterium]|jgi:N6-L-threonylcarbamoyladenine synthase|nr:tRNA (adenosine(37)-N6)-threonylcarbamoyltransferase complex transferase subunit TsaD [Melioribacteraceae bacterium]
MIVLGIESSCDETSVAVIKNEKLLSNLIASQDFHKKYGGVVPELSSRAHLQMVQPLVKQALEESKISINDIDLIAATAGPGLIGALLVGLTYAKGLAYSLKKEFVPVNHIEGHIFSPFLMDEKPEFPMLCLVVSGGHTLLLLVKSYTQIVKLGSTVDDAAGEAFDKVSKMIGLGYPGGPMIQKYAESGDPNSIEFPIAQLKGKFDFSFSGLKTAVLRHLESNYDDFQIPEHDLPNLAASFQNSVVKALSQKVVKAIKTFDIKSLSLVGGVAANRAIRNSFVEISNKYKKKLVIPDLEYCGDNAAMIALRGLQVYNSGKRFSFSENAFPALPEDLFESYQ